MKVLISPGFGAGWSTWNNPEMAVDERLIEAFENGISEEGMKQLCEELGYESYMGGFEDLEIVEVPSGSLFKVREYDGHEYIEIFDSSEWTRAISLGDNMIRRDCFWYRPWKDMGATFDQCEIADTAECPCEENCKWYISKYKADNLVYTILQIWAD